MNDQVIELRHAGASYGAVRALHEVSLCIARGRTTAILGVNGAGKSTTLNVLAGLMAPDRGELVIHEAAIRPRRGSISDGIALSPEGRRLFAQMTVTENLLVGAFSRSDRERIQQDLDRIHDMFPILKKRSRQKAGTLSGGEQQMAAIGRALMRSPSLLLLDEPTLGLSPKMVQTVGDIIAEIAASGLTTVIVEQSTQVALRVSSYAYVLAQGRVAIDGKSEELRSNPKLLSTYLGAPTHDGAHQAS